MSTSPIGCISPARKWIIVNNCATIHATTHTHTHPHTLLLTSHGHSNEIPLSFSVKINNYYWHVCNSISSKYRKYISNKRPFRERDARYRAAAISSTVFSCTRRATSLRAVRSGTAPPRGPRALRGLSRRASVCSLRRSDSWRVLSVSFLHRNRIGCPSVIYLYVSMHGL